MEDKPPPKPARRAQDDSLPKLKDKKKEEEKEKKKEEEEIPELDVPERPGVKGSEDIGLHFLKIIYSFSIGSL